MASNGVNGSAETERFLTQQGKPSQNVYQDKKYNRHNLEGSEYRTSNMSGNESADSDENDTTPTGKMRLFERWDSSYFPPRFNSPILEKRFNTCYTIPQSTRRIQFSLYMFISEALGLFAWSLYFYLSPESRNPSTLSKYGGVSNTSSSSGSNSNSSSNNNEISSSGSSAETQPLQFILITMITSGVLAIVFIVLSRIIASCSKLKQQPSQIKRNDDNSDANRRDLTDRHFLEYEKQMSAYKKTISFLLLLVTAAVFIGSASNALYLPHALTLQLLLFTYICLPLNIKQATGLGLSFSFILIGITCASPLMISYELTYDLQRNGTVFSETEKQYLKDIYMAPRDHYDSWLLLLGLFFSHLTLNIIFAYLKLVLGINARNIFVRKGHALLSTQEMREELDKQTSLIHSCMPKYVADQIEGTIHPVPGDAADGSPTQFRQFMFLHTKDEVSVLFADIVGFTNMSSKRTAAELVDALNDLFQRFDNLCETTGCEKIATLGDCYYACAGCPEACNDHADRTVELGLLIIKSIREFCVERDDNVDMRVGVHSGKVMYGIVGLKKFKFDIFSDAVALANAMETTGIKGAVHISDDTKAALVDKNKYRIVDGKDVERDDKAGKLYDEITDMKADVNGFVNRGRTPRTFLIKPEDQKNFEEDYKPCPNMNAPVKSILAATGNQQIHQGGEMNQHRDHGRGSLTATTDFTQDLQIPKLISWFPLKTNTWTGTFRKPHTENCYRASFDFADFKVGKNYPTTFDNLQLAFTCDMVVAAVVALLAVFVGCIFLNGFSMWVLTYIGLAVVALLGVLYFKLILGRMRMGPRATEGFLENYKSKKHVSTMASTVFKICHITAIILFLVVLTAAVLSSLGVVWNLWHISSYALNHILILTLALCLVIPQTSSLYKNIIVLIISICYIVIGACSTDKIESTQQLWQMIIFISIVTVAVMHANRELETAYRISFYTRREAIQNQYQYVTTSAKTESLLLNIIPKHVATRLREAGSYSEQHACVGIIFAEITNFSVFYEESFQDGKECLRVLNEIISDVDSLLGEEDASRGIDFRDIEKIKTISATYMAASGLSPEVERDPERPLHVLQLLRFAVQVQEKLRQFNADMIEFNFLIRIGFNVGEVTSGVVGTKKLLYDIWGDAVNVASRMYSTGTVGYIQTTEKVAQLIEKLDDNDEFRMAQVGEVFVKGKGMMNTFRLVQDNVVVQESERPCEYVPQ